MSSNELIYGFFIFVAIGFLAVISYETRNFWSDNQ